MPVRISQSQVGNQFNRFATTFPNQSTFEADFTALGYHRNTMTFGGNQIVFSPGGGGGSTTCVFIPTRLAGAISRNQFAQYTYVADTGTAANPQRPILGVFCAGVNSTQNDILRAYFLLIARDVPTAQIIRENGFEPGVSATLASFAIPAPGTVCRIEGVATPGNTQVTVFYNGVQQAQVNDATALQIGLPGFGCRVNTAAATSHTIAAFSAGRL